MGSSCSWRGCTRAARSRAVIEQAKGLLVGTHRCSANEALDRLTQASQDHHVRGLNCHLRCAHSQSGRPDDVPSCSRRHCRPAGPDGRQTSNLTGTQPLRLDAVGGTGARVRRQSINDCRRRKTETLPLRSMAPIPQPTGVARTCGTPPPVSPGHAKVSGAARPTQPFRRSTRSSHSSTSA